MSFFKKLFGSEAAAPAASTVQEEPALEPAPEPAGPLTDEQKVLVKDSWEQVKPISETAAELFYARLFELDPELQPLFAEADMKEQGRKLMQMISIVVAGIDSLGKLIPAVQDLGRRHVDYGVKADHYDTVGAALLDTLEKGLGDAFTPDTKEAWTVTYTTLATVMKDAAYES